MCVTDRNDLTLVVKVALNPQYNQPVPMKLLSANCFNLDKAKWQNLQVDEKMKFKPCLDSLNCNWRKMYFMLPILLSSLGRIQLNSLPVAVI